MTKLLISLVVIVAAVLAVCQGDDVAPKVLLSDKKIYVIDNSGPAVNVPADAELQVAQEVKKEEEPMIKIAPADLSDPAVKAAQEVKIESENNVVDQASQLDPNTMPKFLPLLNFNPFFFGSPDQEQSPLNGEDDSSRPKKLLSVLLMKSIKSSDASPEESGPNQPIKSSFMIFKMFPKIDQEDSERPLFGADSDVDHKRVHLLGGLGDNDPDMIRFNQKLVLTGDEDPQINSFKLNSDDEEQHKFFITSMLDRIKNIFNTFNNGGDGSDLAKQVPFIIRTDDGSSAVIPNDIGADSAENHRSPSLNKCMMLNFMRLKASIYYRTILHLLFFTGVLLFILSMVMITFKTFRKRRFSIIRYHPHNMNVSCIDGDLETKKSKMGAFRPWSGIRTDKSSLIGGVESKTVLIQAPPAYDQVIIDDKTSQLTMSNNKYITLVNESETASNSEPDTKSLPPPDYEETNNKSNQA